MASGSGFNAELIESLPPSYLASMPAQSAPAGVIPNFEHPESMVPVVLGVGSTFLAFAFICFSIRIYTKIFITRMLKWDDLTCSLGFAFAIVHWIPVYLGCLHGGTGKHSWEIYASVALAHYGLVQSLVTTLMATPALGFIKASLLIQYFLLFRVEKYVRVSVYIVGTICVLFYTSVSIAAWVLCSPWKGESLLSTILSWHYMEFSKFSIPTGVIGVVMDLTLLILPMPAVWKLHLSQGKKIGMTFIFLTGGLATIASIVNLYYRIELQSDASDATWKVGYVLVWANIEMFSGVAASSMPTVKQFFSGHKKFFGSVSSSAKANVAQVRSTFSRHQQQPDTLPSYVATLKEWPSSSQSGSSTGSSGRSEKSISDAGSDSKGSSVVVQNYELDIEIPSVVIDDEVQAAMGLELVRQQVHVVEFSKKEADRNV